MKQDQDTEHEAAQDRSHYRKENKLGESDDCPDHHTQSFEATVQEVGIQTEPSCGNTV